MAPRELTVPVYARLGTTEVQLGVLTLRSDSPPQVEIGDAQLDQAGRVLTPGLTGEHTVVTTDRETIYVRTEAGTIQPMDLPLPEPIQDRLTRGYLTRVNPDGTLYHPPGGEQPPTRPATSAPKAHWVGYLVRRHHLDPDTAEAMTQHDLIDKADQLEAHTTASTTPQQVHTSSAAAPPSAVDGAVPRPPKAANKAAWVDWAVAAHGLDRDEAQSWSLADLQALG